MEQPRIFPVAEPTAEQQQLMAAMLAADGKPLNIFTTLAHSPKLLKRFALLGGALLFAGQLPAREREIVILRVGWRCRSVYEFGQHTLIGAGAGLTPEEIARCADVGSGSGWSPDDALLVALADELCDTDTVSDETWSGLAARWSDEQMVELVLLAGYYRMVSGFLNAVGVQLDAGVPGWPDGATP